MRSKHRRGEQGKSKAARRILPMTPRVYQLLSARHESAGRPTEGIFPSTSKCGHFNGDAAKDQHKKAVEDSGVESFVPYTMRHTPYSPWRSGGRRCVRSGPNRRAQFR